MPSRSYFLSLPERLVRSVLGLGAGVAREVGEAVLPEGVRRGQLYQNLVDTTLRFLIERVGGAEGTYPQGEPVAENFLARRTAGNVVEVLGIVAFRASPVWVLAALADVCGLGRQLIPEIADAMKAQGLLDPKATFESMDQLLDGLERTSARAAATINTPPLDIAALREEWRAIRAEASALRGAALPSPDTVTNLWAGLRAEAARQETSVFHASSAMAMSAARSVPDGVRWLSSSATVSASRVGQVFAAALLDHYRRTLDEARAVGFARYAADELRPYARAAVAQFSPERQSLTEAWLEKAGVFGSDRRD
jgi:hypothetical protein